MPTAPNPLPACVLDETALEAAGGGVLLALDADRSRAGHADAFVLRDGEILQVTLDGLHGVATVRVVGPRLPEVPCLGCPPVAA